MKHSGSGLESSFIGKLEKASLSSSSVVGTECRDETVSDLLGGERELVVNHGVEQRSSSFPVELSKAVCTSVGKSLVQVEVGSETWNARHSECMS